MAAVPGQDVITYRGQSRTERVPACSVTVADLRRLYQQLSEKTAEALERYLAALPKPADKTDEEFAAGKAEARRVGRLALFITGKDGEQIAAHAGEALDPALLPDSVVTITMDSAIALSHQSVNLPNRFRLILDVSESPGFDTYNPWQRPTPNNSRLETTGADTTWVAAVADTVRTFFRTRTRFRGWFHSHFTYNVLNWVIGLPGAMWVTYRLDALFPALFAALHPTLRSFLYIYLVLLAFMLFRVLLAGFRWLFPVVELEGSRSIRARGWLAALLGSPLVGLAFDVIKTLFK